MKFLYANYNFNQKVKEDKKCDDKIEKKIVIHTMYYGTGEAFIKGLRLVCLVRFYSGWGGRRVVFEVQKNSTTQQISLIF